MAVCIKPLHFIIIMSMNVVGLKLYVLSYATHSLSDDPPPPPFSSSPSPTSFPPFSSSPSFLSSPSPSFSFFSFSFLLLLLLLFLLLLLQYTI